MKKAEAKKTEIIEPEKEETPPQPIGSPKQSEKPITELDEKSVEEKELSEALKSELSSVKNSTIKDFHQTKASLVQSE